VFQGSVPFETPELAERWYAVLKEMVKAQSPKATLNAQLVKMLEPCCGDKSKFPLPPGVVSFGTVPVRLT
jgi:hypothetical protein